MKLCIDAGHGNGNRGRGYDPGAEAGGSTEAGIVLEWAITGQWLAKQRGIATFLTRDDDSDSDPVALRDDKAEAADCTHFLSLHCNCADGSASGTETFYRDGADKTFAEKVQAAALAALGLKNRGLKTEASSQHSRLAVFEFDGPCALVELGFIDRKTDRDKMKSRDARIAFWTALYDALEGK